uniref:Predicted protein n=1 Tax=Hordeum vulgare subsp. vulgare TaxID=112509 RepID=F2EJ84_HORVV|nr:predicted protein [Hordeum vulgare subsp. vulgare]
MDPPRRPEQADGRSPASGGPQHRRRARPDGHGASGVPVARKEKKLGGGERERARSTRPPSVSGSEAGPAAADLDKWTRPLAFRFSLRENIFSLSPQAFQLPGSRMQIF